MTPRHDLLGPAASADHDRSDDATERAARRTRAARERARRRALRRRAVAIGLAVASASGLAALLAIELGGTRSPARPKPAPTAAVSDAGGVGRGGAVAVRAPRRPGPAPRAVPSPGSLPQTHAYPSGGSRLFRSLMASLWAGIAHGSPSESLAAFFPRGAYVQLKAIGSASSDWSERLVHDFRLDVYAAHQLLGAGAAHAHLIGVEVPAGYGHWIEPGVCYNDVGYYELPNARVVYRENGVRRSFGIASMISWRGVWYVVHLGAILRSNDSGVVDEPSEGPGSSSYSGTC